MSEALVSCGECSIEPMAAATAVDRLISRILDVELQPDGKANAKPVYLQELAQVSSNSQLRLPQDPSSPCSADSAARVAETCEKTRLVVPSTTNAAGADG